MQISKEEKLYELDKILRGRSLHGSESLRAFLRYVVSKAAENQESHLKEYVIATEVFGRGSDFDSRIDSLVRVQAGRLRTKLHEYYATEGKDDPIVIDLPKGQYTPVFSYAVPISSENAGGDEALPVNGSAPVSTAADFVPGPSSVSELAAPVAGLSQSAPPVAVSGVGPNLSPTLGRMRLWQILAAGFGVLAIVLGAVVFNYRARDRALSESILNGASGEIEMIDHREIEPLWGDFLRSSEPVLVVYSNTLFQGTTEEGMKLLKSLDSSGSSIGSPIMPQSEIEHSKQPVIEHYTGIGEVMGAYFLGDFFARARRTSRLKRSLLLNWDDLKTENIVVLGSPAENFFLRDLPQKQDFIFKPMEEENGKKSFGILNPRPRPGEQQKYLAKQDGPSRSQISEDYAVISSLRGLDEKKHLLILAGITTLGTQAAAEYVTKPDYIRELISHLNTAPANVQPKLPRNFQALVKVRVNGGVPVQISYVTHHVLNQ
ncbi:MAG: hypothetical protein ACREEM_48245 [Blastocatellia bacterium]